MTIHLLYQEIHDKLKQLADLAALDKSSAGAEWVNSSFTYFNTGYNLWIR